MPNRSLISIIRNRHVVTSTPEKSARAVAASMRQYHVGAILVVDPEQGKLIGICTERDLVFKLTASGLDAGATTVVEVMTHKPVTLGPEASFASALHLMHEGGFRHMPVIEPGGRPIGVVSVRDALGAEVTSFGVELRQREHLEAIL